EKYAAKPEDDELAKYASASHPSEAQQVSAGLPGVPASVTPMRENSLMHAMTGPPLTGLESGLSSPAQIPENAKAMGEGAAIGGLITAPVATIGALGGGYLGGKGARFGAKELGAGERGQDIAEGVGTLGGGILGGVGLPKGRTWLANRAMENPDVAALKAQGVAVNSRKAAQTLRATETARPYLKGVQTQAEAQARLPQAKAEAWAPRKAVLDLHGNETVPGPSGPATMAELEAERVQLSAINRGLKSGDQMAMKLAEQKGLSQADAIQRERSLNTVLDKEIGKYGVDSQKVRETFAGLSKVEQRLAGRLGGKESAPMGIGKIIRGARIGGGVGEGAELQGHGGFISEPLYRFGQAGRDIAAGRGWLSGSPADISVREGFRVGGEKPALGTPINFTPRGLLPPAVERLGEPGTAELAHPEMFPHEPIGRTPETTTQRAPSGQMQRVYMGTSKPLPTGHTAEGGPIYDGRSAADSSGKQIEPNPAEEDLNALNRNVPEVEEND